MPCLQSARDRYYGFFLMYGFCLNLRTGCFRFDFFYLRQSVLLCWRKNRVRDFSKQGLHNCAVYGILDTDPESEVWHGTNLYHTRKRSV